MEQTVDLSPIVSRLESVIEGMNQIGQFLMHTAQKVDGVSGQVQDLSELHARTREELLALTKDFQAYKDETRRAQVVVWAQTRLTELRQILDAKFGANERTRRMATGLVGALSAGTVPTRLLQDLTAESLVADGRFWLPAALQALAAWIGDNRGLAEAALREASARNDARTAMFFALVCRRSGRHEATSAWLSRYFQCQYPSSLDRDVVVILNGMAGGAFGAAALTSCLAVCRGWIDELAQEAGFQQAQVERWRKGLDGATPDVDVNAFPTLRQCSPATWPRLELALARARRNQVILDYFGQVFSGEVTVPKRLTAVVDELLDSVVRDHDVDELPLARDIAMCEYLIRFRGDQQAADDALKSSEPLFQAKQDFATLLTNVGLEPETIHATEGAQRFAIAMAKEWVVEASADLAIRDRASTPGQVDLQIGSWKGSADSGDAESALAESIARHYDALAEQHAASANLSPIAYLAPLGALAVAVTVGVQSPVSWVLIAVGVAFFLWQRHSATTQQERLRQGATAEKEQATKMLRAALAELTDLQREVQREDAKAEQVRAFFESITPEQYVTQLESAARRTL